MKTKLFLSAVVMALTSVTVYNAFNGSSSINDMQGFSAPSCNVVDENGQPVAENALPDAGSLYDNLFKGPEVSKCVNFSKLDNAPTIFKDGAMKTPQTNFWIIMSKPGQFPEA